MNIGLIFIRVFFLILSIFFITTYMMSVPGQSLAIGAMLGVGIGLFFTFILYGFDVLFRRYNLRSFNIILVGLFIGYLMGQALVLVFNAILDISRATIILRPQVIEIIKISIFLFGTYLGTIMTWRASDELYASIPFIKFTPVAHKKKDLLLDSSAISDPRVIDLASSGLFDNRLIIPRFVIKELIIQTESPDESENQKARRSLETIKTLEEIPDLDLRYNDTDFPEIRDGNGKLFRLARLLDANILTADINRIQIAAVEGIKVINLHALSNALKPLMQAGEKIKIKIQRYGKEPRQGVGYLEDGTMVVVNGGGDYIGEMIDAYVLSIKHTPSGRMIFCNAIEEEIH